MDHPRFAPLGLLAEVLFAAIDATAAAVKRHRIPRGRRAYAGPIAGVDTPLWNAVAAACAARIIRRGDQSRLARHLGISRQRVHLLLVARSAYPDAERALQLLVWLGTGGIAPNAGDTLHRCHLLNDIEKTRRVVGRARSRG